MIQLWSTLLTFLFAHSQLGRWFSDVFDCLSLFDDVLANPDEAPICRSAPGRRNIEGLIARLEDWISFLIHARAAELAGLNLTYSEVRHVEIWTPHAARDWASLMQRYQRLRASFRNIERLAHRRAARLKRERAANPLHLDASHQSSTLCVDPAALCAVVASDRRIASTSALHWGRWIARACAQDGGGRHARGPPCPALFPIKSPRLRSPAFAIAILCPDAAQAPSAAWKSPI